MEFRHAAWIGLSLMAMLAALSQAEAQNLTQIENQQRIQTELQVNPAMSADAGAAAGTATRRIPDGVRLGTLKLDVFPSAVLDGQAVTLAPGFRLLDGLNRIVVPASALGKAQLVAYLGGPGGQVLTAWIVGPAERDEIRRRQ